MNVSIGIIRNVLILEDEPLTAMDLEHMLSEAGFPDIVIKSSCQEAAAWLSGNTPSVAILDIHLKDGVCDDVARTLTERQIPFIVCSASLEKDIAKVFSAGQFLQKPSFPEHLIVAVQRAVAPPVKGGPVTEVNP